MYLEFAVKCSIKNMSNIHILTAPPSVDNKNFRKESSTSETKYVKNRAYLYVHRPRCKGRESSASVYALMPHHNISDINTGKANTVM